MQHVAIGDASLKRPEFYDIITFSGTSIGANIREAKYAHSRPDYITKLQIALKECYETEYRIKIAQKAGLISGEVTKTVVHDCGTIRRMLISSINTVKENTDAEQ